MDDIVYILIGIGWVVFGIYKNYQKQAKSQNKKVITEKSQAPKNSVKDIFEQLFPVDDFKAFDERSQETIVNENASLENITVYEQLSDNQEIKTVRVEKKVVNKKKIVVEEENHFLAEFDAKKAFIYSLIIDRPYR